MIHYFLYTTAKYLLHKLLIFIENLSQVMNNLKTTKPKFTNGLPTDETTDLRIIVIPVYSDIPSESRIMVT